MVLVSLPEESLLFCRLEGWTDCSVQDVWEDLGEVEVDAKMNPPASLTGTILIGANGSRENCEKFADSQLPGLCIIDRNISLSFSSQVDRPWHVPNDHLILDMCMTLIF